MIGTMAAVGACACMGLAVVSGRVGGRGKHNRKRAQRTFTHGQVGSMDGSLSMQQRRRKFNAITRHRDLPIFCPAMPWLPDQINEVIMFGVREGLREERPLVLMALHEVYDETVDGRPIQWPTIPEDCAEIKAIEERVRIRVRRILAELLDAEADEIYPR